MADVFLLIVLPCVIVVALAILFIKYSNKVATSTDIQDRIRRVSRRKRYIHDSNERYTDMNNLMLPDKDESFNKEMRSFFRNSIWTENK